MKVTIDRNGYEMRNLIEIIEIKKYTGNRKIERADINSHINDNNQFLGTKKGARK